MSCRVTIVQSLCMNSWPIWSKSVRKDVEDENEINFMGSLSLSLWSLQSDTLGKLSPVEGRAMVFYVCGGTTGNFILGMS